LLLEIEFLPTVDNDRYHAVRSCTVVEVFWTTGVPPGVPPGVAPPTVATSASSLPDQTFDTTETSVINT
jgi:hypothetical protein